MTREAEDLLAESVALATRDAWSVTGITRDGPALFITLDGAAGALTLEVRPADAGRPAYRTVDAYAYSYRGSSGTLPPDRQRLLETVIGAVRRVLPRLVEARIDAAGADGAPAFPGPYHRHHLEQTIEIAPADLAAYRRDGHVVLRGALAREVVMAARPLLLAALRRAWPQDTKPLAERTDAYSQAFVQVTNLGVDDEVVRAFTHSRRLGKIAADLMGAPGARIYCEDWLIKEAGARITPWHQDAAVYSMTMDAALTLWIPLQDVGAGMGLPRFARGSQRFGIFPVENIDDTSDAAFADIISGHGLAIDECPPMRMGDVSAHDGCTVHGAHPNDSGEVRVVLALHCFADGAVVKAPETGAMARQLADFAPELRPGDPAVSRKWPLIYSSRDPAVGRFLDAAGPAYHLRATVLPHGEAPIDLWIQSGRFRLTPIAGAEDLRSAGGFAVSGLVDAHSHISWPHDRTTPADSAKFMDRNRANYAATGVTLLRDMGSASDAVLALPDVPGLPRAHASGMLVLRYDDFPFTPTPPEALRRVFVERVEHGARWVKVFSDWSSDFGGKENTGFTGHDAVTYELPILSEAVAAVHAAGGRVGAHCFTRVGAEVAIRAGCDSLEHGWGVDEALVDDMALRGVAWIPLLGIAAAMWRTACRDGEPERAAWVEESMQRLATLLPQAHRRGVQIFAGTDWFPEVTIADEIRELHGRGLTASEALAAGSWGARAWLAEPGIEDGAPADLVLYDADPRAALDVLERPSLILIAGRAVDPRGARVRPQRLAWDARRNIA